MISVGILSHYAPKTLAHTLQSYKDAGVFEITDDVFAVLQMSDRQAAEKMVCDSFGVRAICLHDNGKMAWGFKAIYENARHEHILFLENDFVIHASKQDTADFFKNALQFMNVDGFDVVRGRSRKQPGDPNHAMWLSTLSRDVLKNNTHLSECIFWESEPEKAYPSRIHRIDHTAGRQPWYTSIAKYCNYTNNPYVCSKTFFEHAVLPYIGFGNNLEYELTDLWATKHYTCVFGPGLFTHDRSFDGHS